MCRFDILKLRSIAPKPIEVINVGGIYYERTNPDEAKKVVEFLAKLWSVNPRPPSIGVVTFNRDQADLIEQRLEELAEEIQHFNRPTGENSAVLNRARTCASL